MVENNPVPFRAHLVCVVLLEAVYPGLSFDHLVPFLFPIVLENSLRLPLLAGCNVYFTRLYYLILYLHKLQLHLYY